jgi:hypothetical protein
LQNEWKVLSAEGKWEVDVGLRLRCTGRSVPETKEPTDGHFDFVEIGTSDFSTMLQAAKETEIGLSVEPLSYYLNRLPDRSNVKKVNAAISNEDGELPMYFVPEKSITDFGLPPWVRGCNSLGAKHAQVLELVEEEKLDPAKVFAVEMVPVKAFHTLVKEQSIHSIRKLKIDTEGYDGVIMKSYVAACRENPELFAPFIRFENPDAVTSADVVCKNDVNGVVTDDCEAVPHFECRGACPYTSEEEAKREISEVVKFFVSRGYMAQATEDDTSLTSSHISAAELQRVEWGTAHQEAGVAPEGGWANLAQSTSRAKDGSGVREEL